jgi:predicted PurR-regulated permease PerM
MENLILAFGLGMIVMVALLATVYAVIGVSRLKNVIKNIEEDLKMVWNHFDEVEQNFYKKSEEITSSFLKISDDILKDIKELESYVDRRFDKESSKNEKNIEILDQMLIEKFKDVYQKLDEISKKK